MKKIKGYRGIFQKNKILGLEFMDLLFLILAYLFVFLFSQNLVLNFGILAVVYFLLRLYKKGKPDHWTSSVIRFLFTPKHYRLDRERGSHE